MLSCWAESRALGVVQRRQQSQGEQMGQWSAVEVSKEMPPLSLAPARPSGTTGPEERVPEGNLCCEQWRDVSSCSQGGGLLWGSALPVTAPGCLHAHHRQVLCRLKPNGQYPVSTGYGHLLVRDVAR